MKIPQLFVAVACAALFTSCAPSYYLTLAPGQRADIADYGISVGLAENDSLEVRVGLASYDKKTVAFAIDIRNGSDRPVQVSPETFCYLPTLPYPAVASTSSTVARTARVMAIDPEQKLRDIAARQAAAEEKASKVSLFEVLTMVTNTAEDISSIKKKETREQEAERDQRHASDNAYFDSQRAQHAADADALYDQHVTQHQTLLRKHLLAPGEKLTGSVHFPRNDAASHLRVVVYLRERPYSFDFDQRKVGSK